MEKGEEGSSQRLLFALGLGELLGLVLVVAPALPVRLVLRVALVRVVVKVVLASHMVHIAPCGVQVAWTR